MPAKHKLPDVICLMGPTASGKTALAIELASRRNFQLVSVDSAQVYRGMDIGTGKPDPETLARAPHRLIDVRDPAQTYSAADFRIDAEAEIAGIAAQGDIPLLVGGTMLYFKALRDGLAQMPNADPKIRAEIEAKAEQEGWESVHAELAAVDPVSAKRIHIKDPQRLQRALEVFRISGKTLTEYHEDERDKLDSDNGLPFKLHFFAIQPSDRSVLHSKIEHRYLEMLRAGLLDEVGSLRQRGDLTASLPSMKSVGYRQVWQHLDGQLSYDEMVEKGIIATRQLAKRQLTWLRSWEQLRSLEDASNESAECILKFVDSISI
ncbi:MAG: tRNA (adenosine(37)-N6)-dimethylallyltransferase MiaA [Pseudohongiellaceae bacterium]